MAESLPCDCLECCRDRRARALMSARDVPPKEARERAEGLLASMLSPVQHEDWVKNGAFNVRGQSGELYRVGMRGVNYDLGVYSKGVCWNLWPIGRDLPKADRVLATMFWLKDRDIAVRTSYCRDRYDHADHLITDYDGLI